MSEKHEALRLADELDVAEISYTGMARAAAELRRLHAEHEEDQKVIAVWRGRTQRAEAQRDALLEALKQIADGPWPDDLDSPLAQARFDEAVARAAIAKAEAA